jgi:hypothetical protein
VSLILEALKKVERERATPEQRGFLVIGPAAWAPSRSNLGWVLGMVGAAAVAGGAVYLLTRPDAAPVPVAPPRADERVAAGPAAPIAQRPAAPAPADWGPPPDSTTPRHEPRAAAPARPDAVAEPAPAGPALVLNAISERDGVPVAVINDRVVREGDRFDDVRILRIGASEVEVEVAGARRTLRF